MLRAVHCALLCAALGGVGAVHAQPRALTLPAAERIQLDGRLDEAAWARAPVHEAFLQYRPADRQPPPADYRTTLQVIVEADALVIGIRAFDPRPVEIRAPLVRRDQVLRDQDFVAVILDAVGDRRSAQFVRVNAAGVQADGMYIADGDVEDFAPDFEFDAAAARLADGYSVEVRLPFIALRYPLRGGLPWRLMVVRSVPRESGTLWVSAPLTQDALSFIAELQVIDGLAEIGARVHGHSHLAIVPEITLRQTRPGDNGQRQTQAAVGAEIKWRPRADWVFDMTLNPDFSQVELDAPQLAGSTRFALSLPEKRAFFLESTDVLDLPLAAFYSRAVTDPRFGLRATWRGAQAEATALTLRDDGGGLVLLPRAFDTGVAAQDGRSQATLLRARTHFSIGATTFSAGGLVSLRDYGGGRDNRVFGADLAWKPEPETQWRLRTMLSQTTAGFVADTSSGELLPALQARDSGSRWHLTWFSRVPGWNLSAEAGVTSANFRNDNGFVDQAGVRFVQGEVVRRWGPKTLPLLGVPAHEFETYLWLRRAETADGIVVEQRAHPGIWLVAARNSEAWVQARFDAQRVGASGKLHPVRAIAASWSINPTAWFTRLNLELTLGDRVDVDTRADRVGRGIEWLFETKLRGKLGDFGLESEQRFQQGTIAAPDGQRALAEHSARWLGVLHLNARDSVRAVWQGAWFDRAAEPAIGVSQAEVSRRRAASIVFQHRFAPGRSLSVGASRAWSSDAPARQELFVKSALLL